MTGSLSMIMLDQTVVSVSLPTIQEDLGIGETGLQWIINSYILAIASLVALGGRIGDAIGRPLSFMIGVSIFMGGSLACLEFHRPVAHYKVFGRDKHRAWPTHAGVVIHFSES